MTRVAIVTDSAADLPPAVAAAQGIRVVPLEVSFGTERFRAGVDLSIDQFWERLTAPGAPFPTTAAPSPGDFLEVYKSCFEAGFDAIVTVDVSDLLSGTIKSARIARDMLPEREIHIVDSMSASMGVGVLAQLGAELAASGMSAAEIVKTLEARRDDLEVYVCLDTLEYLKRGGRISPAQAAVGGVLSLKPILTIKDGKVEALERVRTKAKVIDRTIELLARRTPERLAILRTGDADAEAFKARLLAAFPGTMDPAKVSIELVGASVGPHIGPDCLGAVALYPAQ